MKPATDDREASMAEASPTTTGFTRKAATRLEEALLWCHFVPASGPEGRDWYEGDVRSGGEALCQRLDVGVALMRRRQVDAGKTLLDECRARIDASSARMPRAVAGVVEEGYCGALAYFHYHRAHHDAARDALDRATDAIAEVVASAPFLVAFATKCYDFCLHRTRIARAEARWQDMWACVQEGREMLGGRRPLCRGDHGATYIDDAEAFFRAATPADDLERRALDLLRDRRATVATYEKRALAASMLPGVVIDY
jgi:hypothetical protein